MTKKIAFVVAIPMTAQVFLMNHLCLLREKYEVHLIANFVNYKNKKLFLEKGIICHHINIVRSINLFSDIKAVYSLYSIFRKERFDCVHSITPKAGLLSAIAGWCSCIPVRIHTFTGQVWATRKGVMRFFLKFFDWLIAFFDTNILVDGESQRQFLIKEKVLKSCNSFVLANGSIAGVKLDCFSVSKEIRKNERQKFNFSDECVVFIFLGRLNHDKGIGELFEAFNRLVVERTNARLLFYGMDEEGYLNKVNEFSNIRINENFFFPGLTDKPYESLQAGDIFVLPTWREGFGSSVIEAQALALPVITSDVYGVADASIPGETGLQCKVGDSTSLYECMKFYYDNPDIRKVHGEKGRERVEEKFNSNIVSKAWVEFYDGLLKESKR